MTPQKVSILSYYLLPNSEKSANNRFRAKPVKYSNFYDIFAYVTPILMKFHVTRHIRFPKLMSNKKFQNFNIQVDRRRPTQKLKKKIQFSSIFYPKTANKEQIAVFMPKA